MNAFLSKSSHLLILLSIIFFACCIGLGSWGLTETSESRYAQISKEMYDSGDYMHPRLMDVYHYHKPPLTYQITALGYKIFGVNEFGARIFMQIALLIQLLLVFMIASLIFENRNKAIMSALIYFSIPLVLISVRNLTTDAYLNTLVLASLFFWLKQTKHPGKKYLLYAFFICLGLIMNTKGPVGLIFPVLFIISYKLIYNQKIRFDIHSLIGLILFVVLSIGWTLLLLKQNPAMLDYFLDEQILRRINSKSYNRSKPFWFYLITFPIAILPWIWPTINGIFRGLFKKKKTDKKSKLLAVNLILIVFIFSLFSTKLILYILPVSLFVALISAQSIFNLSSKHKNILKVILATLTGLILLGLFFLPLMDKKYEVNYIHASVVALLIIASTIVVIKRSKDQNGQIMFLAVVFGLNLLFCSTIFLKSNDLHINSVKRVMTYIQNTKELKDRQIIVHNYLLPSAAFYSNQKIITLNKGHNTVQRDMRFQNDASWKDYLIDIQNDDGLQRLNALMEKPVILLVRRRGDNIESSKLFENKGFKMIDFDKWVIYY